MSTYIDTTTRTEVLLPPLVTGSEMPGVPEPELAALSQQVRTECGWHVAPRITETVTVSIRSVGRVLVLPTKLVHEVTAVRVWDPYARVMRPLLGWDPRTGWDPVGLIVADWPFPAGMRTVEVDLVHGHFECPPDLRAFLGRLRRGRIVQESLAGRSVTYVGGDSFRMSPVIGKYRLEPAL